MTDTHMKEAVKRINEARELGKAVVNLSDLEIQEIPKELLELADTLVDLYISNTGISDISLLANLTNLKALDLDRTNITDISPLAPLTNLIWLILRDTNVSDVSPLANLTNLKEINLNYIKVSDISSLANLTNLEDLGLLKCPLVKSSENIQALKKLRENGCEIFGVEEFMK